MKVYLVLVNAYGVNNLLIDKPHTDQNLAVAEAQEHHKRNPEDLTKVQDWDTETGETRVLHSFRAVEHHCYACNEEWTDEYEMSTCPKCAWCQD